MKCDRYFIVRDYLLENNIFDLDDLNKDDVLFCMTIIPDLEKYIINIIKDNKKSKNKKNINEKSHSKIVKFIEDWLLHYVYKCE